MKVTRKIYVPDDQGYARFLEIVSNPTAASINHNVLIETSLGAGSSTDLLETSGSDLVLDASDDWIVMGDGSLSGSPTVVPKDWRLTEKVCGTSMEPAGTHSLSSTLTPDL